MIAIISQEQPSMMYWQNWFLQEPGKETFRYQGTLRMRRSGHL